MLHDCRLAECPPLAIFAALAAEPAPFHLTGSRYLGGARPESDWDFVTQDGPAVRAALERLGFTPVVTAAGRAGLSSVGGTRVAAICQRVADGVKVQVQLARSLAVMCTVRDIIRAYVPAHAEFDYAQRKHVWDALAAIVQMEPRGHERLPGPAPTG